MSPIPRKMAIARSIRGSIRLGKVYRVHEARGTMLGDPEPAQFAERGQGPYSMVLADEETGRLFRISVDEIDIHGNSIARAEGE